MSEDVKFVLVRRDSKNQIEIVKKEAFDATGYSFLKYRETEKGTLEEWVETDKLEEYKEFEEFKKLGEQ